MDVAFSASEEVKKQKVNIGVDIGKKKCNVAIMDQ